MTALLDFKHLFVVGLLSSIRSARSTTKHPAWKRVC